MGRGALGSLPVPRSSLPPRRHLPPTSLPAGAGRPRALPREPAGSSQHRCRCHASNRSPPRPPPRGRINLSRYFANIPKTQGGLGSWFKIVLGQTKSQNNPAGCSRRHRHQHRHRAILLRAVARVCFVPGHLGLPRASGPWPGFMAVTHWTSDLKPTTAYSGGSPMARIWVFEGLQDLEDIPP